MLTVLDSNLSDWHALHRFSVPSNGHKTAFAAMMLNEALLLTAAALALQGSPLESFVTKLLTGYLFHALEGKQGHH